VKDIRYHRAICDEAEHIVAGINAVCAEGGFFYSSHYIPSLAWEAALHKPETVPDHLLLVAEDKEGELVGAAQIFPLAEQLPGGPVGELGIFVLRPFRGQGIGLDLMREVLRRAAAWGYVEVVLSVLATNTRAIHLYQKLGFTATGQRRREYAFIGEQDELVMLKPLMIPGETEDDDAGKPC
jgi:ribosomal protein S18 acetylase RimI-like enzyme